MKDKRTNPVNGIEIYTGSTLAADTKEKRLIELAAGTKPENDNEKKLSFQLQKMQAENKILDVPSM